MGPKRDSRISCRLKIFFFILILALVSPTISCNKKEASLDIIKLSYWEKWTGFEGEAMQAVVDLFNSRKIKNREGKVIQVEMITVSQIDRRLLTATAGGNPPDIAGIWTWLLTVYADKGALLSLDDYLEKAGITKEHYLPVFWEICEYNNKMWGLPSTPASLALHWNKRLFREAGLDPHTPPRTIGELDLMAEKLTLIKLPDEGKTVSFYEFKNRKNYRDLLAKGEIVQAGFLPSVLMWWPWSWGYWFGGRLWNGKDTITADEPENIRAYEWIRAYSLKYGINNINKFSSGFGAFASPQNAFLSSKAAMVLQGVWMYNFIDKYATGMEWGAASFPSGGEEFKDVSFIEADVLVIPRGAKYPDEAFKFISFVNQQEPMELLCQGQRKFTPLREVSPAFYQKHRNPYIRMFRKLAESPNAFTLPKTTISQEYQREMNFAYETISDLKISPQGALKKVTVSMQRRLDREREMAKKIK